MCLRRFERSASLHSRRKGESQKVLKVLQPDGGIAEAHFSLCCFLVFSQIIYNEHMLLL